MKISVIVPCFNAADTLKTCLESVIAQSIQVEIIVQDGGSTDQTETAIAPYIPQIAHYASEPDEGVYEAMNKGIEKASGDWLYFLGADDELASSNCLAQMVQQVDEATDLVIGRTHNLPPRHPKVPAWYEPQWDQQIRIKNIVHHQGVLYRRRVFKTYRYPHHYRILADYHLNLSLYYSEAKAELKDVHVANCASDGLSKSFTPALYREEWKIKKEVLPAKTLWYQPAVLATKFLRKRLS